jgi:hypothetical protein
MQLETSMFRIDSNPSECECYHGRRPFRADLSCVVLEERIN